MRVIGAALGGITEVLAVEISNRSGNDMKVVGIHTWAIKRVARDKGQHWVAVPYVSPGAAKRLPLKRGDVLITRFDDATIMAGQTDPTEIARYIRKGVKVHNEPWLHAKVYVAPKRATRLLLPAANALGRAIRQRGCGRRRAIYFPPNRCDELAALRVREWLGILPGHFDYDT
jgi:hypothetical protein